MVNWIIVIIHGQDRNCNNSMKYDMQSDQLTHERIFNSKHFQAIESYEYLCVIHIVHCLML